MADDKLSFADCVALVRETMAEGGQGYGTAVRCQHLHGHPADGLMKAAMANGGMDVLPASKLPAPDQLVDYGNGLVEMAMFHFGGEGMNYITIAQGEGFEVNVLMLADDNAAAAQQLYAQYSADADGMKICAAWQPQVPEGWSVGAKYDTEDGPIALLVRRTQG